MFLSFSLIKRYLNKPILEKNMKEVSHRERSLPHGVIQKLLRIAEEEKNIISLGPGEPDFEMPAPLLRKAHQILNNHKKNKVTHYAATQGVPELRQELVKKLKKRNKITARDNEVLVTTGSQSGLFASLLSALDPGDQIIIPNPGYMAYLPETNLVSGVPVFAKCTEKEDFCIHAESIKNNVTKKTRAILINTPSNPTGAVLSKKQLEEIADVAVEKDLYVFSDEAYEDIIYDDKKHISMRSLNGMKDYAASFYTFSKSYAMCGFRLGYCCGPKEIIEAMGHSLHYMTISAPHISQLLAIEALKMKRKYINNMVKEYDRRRKLIVPRLNEMGLTTAMPSGAFYAFANIQNFSKNSAKFAAKLLRKSKVAVVPGTEFGKHGEGYLRFSFATDYRLIKQAMNRLEKFIKKKQYR
jgi:aminotransferase